MSLRRDARYLAFPDPFDLWIVWDKIVSQPAEFAEFVLMGLAEADAREACTLLNELHARLATLDGATD